MANRRKKKTGRNANLAVAPVGVIVERKKSTAVNEGTDPYDESLRNGKNGYAFKSQQAGDYRKVGAVIKKFRQENPDSTYLEVYEALHNRFPWIFDRETKDMYSGNVAKIIKDDPLWRNCYFINQAELIALAEVRLAEILDNEATEDKVIISAYDKLKKYELIEKQLELGNSTDTNICSAETVKTLSEIEAGLKEFNSSEYSE